MTIEQPESIEEQKQAVLKELLVAGDLDMALQFEEKVLGNIRDDRIPADTPQEDIQQAKEALKASARERVLELTQKCLDLGFSRDEINAAAAEWEQKKER